MKEKVLVTYSVQYCKEVELEITEEIKEGLNRGMSYNWNTKIYDRIWNMNQEVLSELRIPTIYVTESLLENEEVEYVDGSFDIETFEKQL